MTAEVLSPTIFALIAARRSGEQDARAAALGDLLGLAISPRDDAHADAARAYLRGDGWHVAPDDDGMWQVSRQSFAPSSQARPTCRAAAGVVVKLASFRRSAPAAAQPA